MNGPFRVAQVTGAVSAAGPVRVIKIEKPAGGQAVTAEASFDGTVKIDFTAIANEKITLVHIGERLIILFDNQSTVTIIPFFDSMGVPLANITIESNGKEFTGAEFASTFPITTDQSVLPAAGDGVGGTPASGANFANASVDPLSSPNPLDLLPPEALPPIQFSNIEGPVPANNGLPSVGDNDPVLIDDDDVSGAGGNPGGVGDDDPTPPSGFLSVDYGPDGPGSTLLLATGAPPGFSYALSPDGTVLEISQGGTVVIVVTLSDATSGEYTVTQVAPIDHLPGDDENNLILTINYRVTDLNGDFVDGTLDINIDDDTPVQLEGEQPSVSALVLEDGLDENVGDAGDQSNGNRESGETTADDEASSTGFGSLAGLVSVGADQPAIFSMSTDTSDLPVLFSKGAQLAYSVDAATNTLTATAHGDTIFTLTINSDGSWTFDLDDQLDHVDDDTNTENFALRSDSPGGVGAIDFSSLVVVTDNDGDPLNGLSTGSFTIAVQDDIPIIPSGGRRSKRRSLGLCRCRLRSTRTTSTARSRSATTTSKTATTFRSINSRRSPARLRSASARTSPPT